MDVSPIQVLLIFIVAFIAGIDQFSFLESLYQPIVTGFLVGLISWRRSDWSHCWWYLSAYDHR